MKKTAVKGIAFDLEGPIIDLEFLHHSAHIAAARDVGLTLTIEECFEKIPHFIGGPDWKIAEEIAALALGNPDPQSILSRDFFHFERMLEDAEIRPRPGFREFLAWLDDRGLKTAIGSAVERRWGDIFLEKSGLKELFRPEYVLMSDDVKNQKPAPDVYIKTAKIIGISPSEQIVFEDSPRGVRAGVAAGSLVIGMPVYDTAFTRARLVEAGVKRIFTDWKDIDPEVLIREA
jgi:beta-phosphoglucomutase